MNKAREILELIKNNEEIQIPILKDDKKVLNKDTGNLNVVFSYDFGYGVYGDCIKSYSGQLDSRKCSDQELLETFKKLIDEGYEFGEIFKL